MVIARRVVREGTGPGDGERLAAEIADELAAPDLAVAFVFASWELDAAAIARVTQDRLRAPVVGCATVGVLGARGPYAIGALGLYGGWIRAGVGVARELSRSALARSRDAVHGAATALGLALDALDPARHVVVTLVDGRCGHVEPFCIGSAAAVPQLQVVGGCAAVDPPSAPPELGAPVWARGDAVTDAGVAVVLELARPFHVVTSAHLEPTTAKTVVTAASGRVVDQLDGRPALERLRELVVEAGLDATNLLDYTFARYVDGMPYVRSMTHFEGSRIDFACAVEPGHVLRLMKPGDLIGTTRRDLATAAERVGGAMEALLAFSCQGRHMEARAHALSDALADAYAAHPTTGFHSYGEQTGMLLVNHTLTGLVIG